jgi:hypothetical protein
MNNSSEDVEMQEPPAAEMLTPVNITDTSLVDSGMYSFNLQNSFGSLQSSSQ